MHAVRYNPSKTFNTIATKSTTTAAIDLSIHIGTPSFDLWAIWGTALPGAAVDFSGGAGNLRRRQTLGEVWPRFAEEPLPSPWRCTPWPAG